MSDTHSLPGSQFSVGVGNTSEQNKDACLHRFFILMVKTQSKYLCCDLEAGKRYRQENAGQDGGWGAGCSVQHSGQCRHGWEGKV